MHLQPREYAQWQALLDAVEQFRGSPLADSFDEWIQGFLDDRCGEIEHPHPGTPEKLDNRGVWFYLGARWAFDQSRDSFVRLQEYVEREIARESRR